MGILWAHTGAIGCIGLTKAIRQSSLHKMSTVVFIKLAKSKLKARNHIRSIIRSSPCAYVNWAGRSESHNQVSLGIYNALRFLLCTLCCKFYWKCCICLWQSYSEKRQEKWDSDRSHTHIHYRTGPLQQDPHERIHGAATTQTLGMCWKLPLDQQGTLSKVHAP